MRLLNPVYLLLTFILGAVASAVIAELVPDYVKAVRDWFRPVRIEACSSLAKSEISVIRENGEVTLVALYPVDNHFYFYFQNGTGAEMREPRFFLNFDGYEGRTPEFSKVAILVSSYAAQQTADIDWEGDQLNIRLDILPDGASFLFEALAWEPIDLYAEVTSDNGVIEFFQPADCREDASELTVRNIEPVFKWVSDECTEESWGAHCPRPSIDGTATANPGEAISMSHTIVSRGEILDPMSATVTIPSFPQLLSEILISGQEVEPMSLVSRNAEGVVLVQGPQINFNIVASDEEQSDEPNIDE